MLFYTPFSSHRTRNVTLSQAGTDPDGHLHAHTLKEHTYSCTNAHSKVLSMSSRKGFAGFDQNPCSQQ